MQVIKRGFLPSGEKIQIEDWSGEYSFKSENATIGAYPISKKDVRGQFAPKEGRTFRIQFDFETEEQTEVYFNKLIKGEIELTDLKDYHTGKKEYLQCI